MSPTQIQARSGSPNLLLLPSLRALDAGGNRIRVTQKFLTGVAEFARYWPGSVSVAIEPTDRQGSNMDDIEVGASEFDYQLHLVPYTASDLAPYLQAASVVLASGGHRQNEVSKWCASVKVPCVYVTEYSLKTRFQIIRADVKSWVGGLRRMAWEWRQERLQASAIALAQGVQCNGTPTHSAYASLNPDPLLFFDTRVSDSMLVTADALDERLASLATGRPLRLAFSGRLVAIKGADHLIDVAEGLSRRGVPFSMTICGDGALRQTMEARIVAGGLQDRVKLLGVLEFERELVPLIRTAVDLFVCCHRQGDPSCTYLETMSCGVPIIGYDNEAFVGVVAASGVGWAVPMNQPDSIAQGIASLSNDRASLSTASRRALSFARMHTVERAFQSRVEHLRRIAQRVHPTA